MGGVDPAGWVAACQGSMPGLVPVTGGDVRDAVAVVVRQRDLVASHVAAVRRVRQAMQGGPLAEIDPEVVAALVDGEHAWAGAAWVLSGVRSSLVRAADEMRGAGGGGR
jgi:hypothetical protein